MLRTLKHDSRRSPRRVLAVLGCLALTGYFAHHAISGRHGLEARKHLTARLPQVEQRFATLDKVRERLKLEVALLTPDKPARDLVEEAAREVLGYVLPSEIVWVGR